MKIKNFSELEVSILTYAREDEWEEICFSINKYNLSFYLILKEGKNNFSTVYTKEEAAKIPYIHEGITYLQDEAFTTLKEKIYNHPKIRLKKLL